MLLIPTIVLIIPTVFAANYVVFAVFAAKTWYAILIGGCCLYKRYAVFAAKFYKYNMLMDYYIYKETKHNLLIDEKSLILKKLPIDGLKYPKAWSETC